MNSNNAPPRLPSIDGLRAFQTVAGLGSLERAGEQLNITASAVSKRIATVEYLIGTPLFNRSAKTLSLTATGMEYLGAWAAERTSAARRPQRSIFGYAALREHRLFGP